MAEINWKIIPFNKLTINDLYDLYALRIAIFVVEQNCPYQEIDEKDKLAIHVLGYKGKELVAVARVLPPNVSYKEAAIGRFAVAINYRKNGIANELILKCFQCVSSHFGDKVAIRISAQEYVANFYKKHGFKSSGKHYLEDNIPHVEMLRNC